MEFGTAIDLYGDRAVVGGHGYVSDSSAYLLRYENGIWFEERRCRGSDSSSWHSYGSAVALGPDFIFVGARAYVDLANPCVPQTTNCAPGVIYVHTVESVFERGDVDESGTVNVADAVLLLAYLFPPAGSVIEISCDDAADANADGSLSILDVVTLLAALFPVSPTMPTTLPAPTGGCGAAPLLGCSSFSGCP